jgi:hypothetical protein
VVLFGSEGDDVRKCKARDVKKYLMAVAAAEMTETRRFARQRRPIGVRAEEGRIFLPVDFDLCIRTSPKTLSDITNTAMLKLEAGGRGRAVQVLWKFPCSGAKVESQPIGFAHARLPGVNAHRFPDSYFAQMSSHSTKCAGR